MRHSNLGFCLALLFVGLCFSDTAHALPPAIESRVQASIQELKSQNAGIEKDACGQLILVQSELVIETAKGITNRPFPTETRETWGCKSTPGSTIKTGSKFTTEQESSNGETKSIYVHVVMELYFDREKSATLEGRVTDMDGKSMRHTKVRLVNSRNGSSYETDGDGEGFYEIQVPSGEYSVTASAESCSKSVPKQLCAYGQASGPTAKHGSFRQDFKLDCTGLVLDIKGSSAMSLYTSEDGMTFKAHSTSRIEGQSSLSVDPKTSQISGEGNLLTLFNDDFVDETIICDEGECHTIEGLPGDSRQLPDYENSLHVKGTLTGGVANMTVVMEGGAYNADVKVNVDGRQIMRHTASDTTEPYSFEIKLPYTEGSSTPFDFTYTLDGGSVEYHLVFTLKKKEDAGPTPRLSPSAGSDSHSGSGPSAPTASGNGGPFGGSTSGGPIGRTVFTIPQDLDIEEEEEAEEVYDASSDIQDIMTQAMGSLSD